MTPSRPYLLRAFYEWLVDNELTPHLVVDAEQPDVEVPLQFVQNGQIVLNIAPHAVTGLQMTNDVVSCSARFGGSPHALYIPMWAVKAIYARENGAGTVFEAEPVYQEMLNVEEEGSAEFSEFTETTESPELAEVTSGMTPVESEDDGDGDDDTPKPPKRPTLRVVK
ncbi:ClpXP protease specificity-enhancing factor [Echinimonas agarilytica]|uniref:ClpXP protease specificity-enhancing factor n=1 Tax=Echinimonas agarilytica TaxID=1215918 RepID=A0AA41W4J0_9GAMM|nr:ClpXP protease specificity-enhancing factor [Echinimonas agarilytica]MCM2678635.1 ClpXP protease specificity-enhancing factor [Echinimonas agarilytica]